MRLGIFGGSFDPVHLGHLWIGEAATETLSLDRLLWLPSATQPLIGSDSLASMRQWHQPERLLEQVVLAGVRRGGEAPVEFDVLDGLVSDDRIEQFRRSVIKMPVIEISSRDIRGRVGQGRSIRHRVPHAVQSYIEANALYGFKPLGEASREQ